MQNTTTMKISKTKSKESQFELTIAQKGFRIIKLFFSETSFESIESLIIDSAKATFVNPLDIKHPICLARIKGLQFNTNIKTISFFGPEPEKFHEILMTNYQLLVEQEA